jgi:NitT/TauT family transport system ATP-binding protein
VDRAGKPVAAGVRGVSLAYGEGAARRTILDSIDFDVRPGEFLCLVGPSGCGKTTLLRLLAGLARPDAGEILVDGVLVTAPSLDRAIVFQDYSRALLPWRTVEGNVMLGLEATGVRGVQARARVIELLELMSLAHVARHFPAQLSGGMQQRVQIARCLAQSPRLLLMDEPFGALDAMTRQTLQDEVARIARAEGRTVIFITHDLEEAIYLGDRVIVLAADPGRIVEVVEVDIARPRTQLETREDARFLAHRHRLFGLLAGQQGAAR